MMTTRQAEAAEDSDEVLMAAFRDGDDEAFAALYERYRGQVFRFVWRRVGDPGRAEEIAADVFVALVRRRAAWRPEARFKTYVYRIATNRCISELQRAERRFVVRPATDESGDPVWPEAVSAAASPFDAAARSELWDRVTVALDRLADDFRLPLLMEIDEYGRAEIADRLGIPVETVKTRIFRARRKLNAMLA
jgi:RNA polymerase sigma-70 factor (ECF subfamily)